MQKEPIRAIHCSLSLYILLTVHSAMHLELISNTDPSSGKCIGICVFVNFCICVFVNLCICAFVHLCISAFVYLCNALSKGSNTDYHHPTNPSPCKCKHITKSVLPKKELQGCRWSMCLQIISQSKKKCCKIMAKHPMCKTMRLDVVYLGISIRMAVFQK